VTASAPPADEHHRRRDVPVGVAMVGMVAIAWWPAFTLGVWGEVFFDDILALWAASTAAFVFVLVERRPVGGRLARALVLLLPSVWLVLNFVVADDTTDVALAIVDLAAIAAVLLGIPFTLWVLVRVVWPDFATETRRRTKWLIAVVVLGVAVTSFVLGLNQEHFLTCGDFDISGNSAPPGCTPGPAD
jgi:Sec-independent protein secretion pathway component TatC